MAKNINTEVKKLSLKKGDILVIQRSFNHTDWQSMLQHAGKEAGIDFNVPYVFVDNIKDLAVIRLEDIKNV